jgi:UDP-2,3-diacylglucosamine hydrolase
MNEHKNIYFASDFHLGTPDEKSSREREERIIRWLDQIKQDAKEIYLVGDIFDFWFEYNKVIPKGFIRLQGKIAEVRDSGIPIFFFTGNHDMWMFDYFEKELNVKIYREPIQREYNGKKFYIGHGDGLGPGDFSYKILKKIFASKICQWLFARIHPNLGLWIANKWSKSSRIANDKKEQFLGEENEWLAIYSKEVLQKEHFDYFIFGHRHLPLDIKLNEKSRYINLGEWIHFNSYAVFDGQELYLKYFEKD